MLRIRLLRIGRKHDPYFRLVVTDSRKAPQSGAYLENLGSYNSRKRKDTQLKAERIKHWLSKGAQVSDTAHNLLVSSKVIEEKKRKISIKPKKKQKAAEPVEKEGS